MRTCLESARERRRRIARALRASPCRFRWRVRGQELARQWYRAIPIARFFRGSSSCALSIVHGIDFGGEARVDGVATELAVRGEQAVLWGEYRADDGEISNLAIMREAGIDRVQRGLHGGWLRRSGNQGTEITAPISDHHYLLCARKMLGNFFFDWFGSDVVAGI